MKSKIFTVLTYFFIFLYIYSLGLKILNFEQFKINLVTSPIIPNNFIIPLIYLIPALEAITLFFLIFYNRIIITHYLNIFTLNIFSSYLILYYFFSNSDCGCSKLFPFLSYNVHIIVNIIFIGLSIFLLFLSDSLRKK